MLHYQLPPNFTSAIDRSKEIFAAAVMIEKTVKMILEETIELGLYIVKKEQQEFSCFNIKNAEKFSSEISKLTFNHLEYYDGGIYTGQLKNGIPEGIGKIYYPQDTRHQYEGQWSEGKYHGLGIETFGGYTYFGEYKNDKPDGKGVFFSNLTKTTYLGEFKEGEKSGTGITYFGDGSIYMGQYSHNKMEGKGIAVFPNQSLHIGEFSNDTFHGKGATYWGNGAVSIGEYIHGNQGKIGGLFFENGMIYKGEFSENLLHGEGIFAKDSISYYSIWDRNQVVFQQAVGKANPPSSFITLVLKAHQAFFSPYNTKTDWLLEIKKNYRHYFTL